jgi:16S rRNA (guanine527-N7)-methyltransferase
VTPAEFARNYGVSRETCERLEAYIDLLARWNARINLVADASLRSPWVRHIADSAQLFPLAPESARSWIDLGSGAGFPGLPVAAIAAEKSPDLRVTLVESDSRKAAVLATAAREMDLDVMVEPRRIESMAPKAFDVVSARALAPLTRLCGLAHRFSGTGTVYLFLKSASADSELTEAAAAWHIQAERIASRTDPDSAVLRILELERRS